MESKIFSISREICNPCWRLSLSKLIWWMVIFWYHQQIVNCVTCWQIRIELQIMQNWKYNMHNKDIAVPKVDCICCQIWPGGGAIQLTSTRRKSINLYIMTLNRMKDYRCNVQSDNIPKNGWQAIRGQCLPGWQCTQDTN